MNKIKASILYSLQRKPKNFWQLLAENQYLLGDVLNALNELYEEGLISVEKGKLRLTKKGKETLNKNASKFIAEMCKCCNGKIVVAEGEFREIAKTFKRISKQHPPILAEFYQGRVRPEDTIARVALMHRYNDVVDKEIVLIGDDDLLSIALALTHLPKRIVVFDIDKRLGEFINSVNKKYKLNIEFVEYDVATPLPKNFVKKFDVFSTEPLETESGFKAFFARGASCLRTGGAGYIGLTALEVSFKRWARFEKLFIDHGFVITDIIRDFSWYYDSEREEEREQYQSFAKALKFDVGKNPGVCWYRSTLFRIESLGKHTTPIPWNKKIKIIPVDEESFTHPSMSSKSKKK
jgi:hypothetical protein